MDPKEDKGKASKNTFQVVDGNSSKPAKRRHTGLKVFLILVLVLFVIPVAALYICFFDVSPVNEADDADFNTNEIFENAFITSLDDVEQNEGFYFNVSTETLNKALFKARNDAIKGNDFLKECFTGIEVETEDEKFTFKFAFNLKTVFQTRIYLETKLDYREIQGDGKCLVFEISSIKLGRISGVEGLVKMILPNFLSDEKLAAMFSSVGLTFKSNIKQNMVYYPLNNFTSDMQKLFPSQEGLFNSALKFFLDPNKENNALAFTKNGLEAYFTLEPYKTNGEYVSNQLANGFRWKELVTERCRNMIKDGVIGANYTGKDAQGNKIKLHEQLYSYLIKGSDVFLDESYLSLREYLLNFDKQALKDKYFIEDIDNFDGYVFVEVENPRTDPQSKYYGTKIVRPTKTMSDILAEDTQANLQHYIETKEIPDALFEIDEELLSSLLRSSSIIGDTYHISGKIKSNPYQISPITITDAYASIVDNSIRFLIEICLNDYPTVVCLETHFTEECYDPETYTLNLEISDMCYGTSVLTDDFKLSILDLVEESFKKENDMLSFELDEQTKTDILIVNCTKIINSLGEYKDLFENTFTTGINVIGDTLEDDGKIQFTLAKK